MRTLSRHRRRGHEQGETMIELLMTMAIVSVAVLTIMGGAFAAVRTSDVHRKRTTAGVEVRALADALQTRMLRQPTGYTACATPVSYANVYTAPAGFRAEVTSVLYWSSTQRQFVTACSPDVGLQRVSVRVTSLDGTATESLDVVLRKPCRPADPPC